MSQKNAVKSHKTTSLKPLMAVLSKATGNRQQATGNRQQATGNRQQATGNRQQATVYTLSGQSCQLPNCVFCFLTAKTAPHGANPVSLFRRRRGSLRINSKSQPYNGMALLCPDFTEEMENNNVQKI
jgi:hypothetical protein